MGTTIILALALFFSYATFHELSSKLIEALGNKASKDVELAYVIVACILWAWFYYLTTH